LRSWVGDRRVLAVAGLAVTGTGLGLGWDWLTAVGVAPLIVSAAPCLLMCALGLCMMGRGHQASSSRRAGHADGAARLAMTRNTRILLASAISLMVVAAAGLVALMLIPAAPQITKSMTGAIGGPFTLTATDGRTVTEQTYRGKWLLIYFGYTSCPVPNSAQRYGRGSRSARPRCCSRATDLHHGRPEARYALAEYLKSFDPHIVALTGTEDQIAAVVREYHIYVAAHPESGHDYTVDHSSFFYLVNPDGKFVNVLRGDLSGDELAGRLRDLMKHTV
jgi:protein SCO1/2